MLTDTKLIVLTVLNKQSSNTLHWVRCVRSLS